MSECDIVILDAFEKIQKLGCDNCHSRCLSKINKL
jgi:hypothetical protein